MRQRRKIFRRVWFLSFGIFLLPLLSNLAYSGTRFSPTYRVCPPCNYNPYDAGSIAVVATEKSEEVDAVISGVTSTLSRDGFFKLVAREQVEAVLKEQAFGLSGFVDPQKAAGVGKLIGADSMFVLQFGGFSSSENRGEASVEFGVWVDKGYWRVFHAKTEEEGKPKGKSAPVKVSYTWEEKTARASASGVLINTSTAQQLCSGLGTAEKKVMGVKQSGGIEVTSSFKEGDWNWYLSSDGVAVAKKEAEKSYKQAIKTSSEIVDYGKLPGDAILKPELIRQCGPKVAREIIPALVTREREVGDGKTRISKAAILKGKGGAWDEAEELLLLAVSAEPRDHDAWGGLGICYEYKEMKIKARECYSKARQLDPKNKGFPNWLKEIEYMLNDYSAQYEAPESPIAEFESLPYVVSLEKKGEVMKINPRGKVGREGDIVKVFGLKIEIDPETNEVLESSKEPKGVAVIVKATDKLWTTSVLKKRKGINVQDKVEIIEPARKGYLPVVAYHSGQKEIILSSPEEENKPNVGSKLTIVKSKYKVDFDKDSEEYSIEIEDKIIGEAVITEVEDSQIKAKFLEGPKEKPKPGEGEFWGKI